MPVSDPLLKNLGKLHLDRLPAATGDTDTPGQKNFGGAKNGRGHRARHQT